MGALFGGGGQGGGGNQGLLGGLIGSLPIVGGLANSLIKTIPSFDPISKMILGDGNGPQQQQQGQGQMGQMGQMPGGMPGMPMSPQQLQGLSSMFGGAFPNPMQGGGMLFNPVKTVDWMKGQ